MEPSRLLLLLDESPRVACCTCTYCERSFILTLFLIGSTLTRTPNNMISPGPSAPTEYDSDVILAT
ncbi:hypothetical protein Hanom_Chr09g00838311 [Helianthus anomalus]